MKYWYHPFINFISISIVIADQIYNIPQASRPASSPVPATGVSMLPAPVLVEGVAALLVLVADCSRLPTC